MEEFIEQHIAEHKQQQLPGNSLTWLNQLRHQALDELHKHGLPTLKDEEWKYTHIAPITKQFMPSTTRAHQEEKDFYVLPLEKNLDCHQLHFIDGLYHEKSSHIQTLPADIIICNLAKATTQHPELLENYLNNVGENGFNHLNTLNWQDGIFIYIPKNTTLEKPIHLSYFSQSENKTSSIRNCIIANENSHVTIIESYYSDHQQVYFNNVLSHVFCQAYASVDHIKIQQESEKAYHIGYLFAKLQQSSLFNSHSYSFGGMLTRSDIIVDFEKAHAHAELNGVYLAKNYQHVDHHTTINHHHPECHSSQNYKGILNHRARGVFNGKVYVAKDAQLTRAHQQNKNILLSDRAEIDTKPQLEIFADDVKCTHGATVGQIDKDALYYLQARGVSKEQAQRLLINAFADDVLAKINHSPVSEYLKKLISEML